MYGHLEAHDDQQVARYSILRAYHRPSGQNPVAEVGQRNRDGSRNCNLPVRVLMAESALLKPGCCF
jgi:hypothetical protein